MSAQEENALKCANHPNVTTYVRCSRCGKPICTRCMNATPVGYRCADCYNPQIAPLYKIEPSRLPAAIGAGLAVSVVAGVAIAFLPGIAFFLALLMGFFTSDAIARFANEKRGQVMQLIGVSSIVVGLLVSLLVYGLRNAGGISYALANIWPRSVGFFNANYTGFDIFTVLMFGMAAFMCWIRLR